MIGTREALELLRWLTEADSRATGPAMWSGWKANLIDDLVRRTTAVLAGADPEPLPVLNTHQAELVAAGTLAVEISVEPDGDHVTVVAPDRHGLLATVVGVMVLQRLDVRRLNATIHQADAGRPSPSAPTALIFAAVTPRLGGELPDPVLLREELARALSGQLDVAAALAERAAAYPMPAVARLAAPRVLWDDQPSGDAAVVQVRAADAPGLLARLASTLHDCGLQMHMARCTTLGAEVIDAFYVTEPDGTPVASPERRQTVSDALLAVT
jgi:[protein-PII] uridylyltransferase